MINEKAVRKLAEQKLLRELARQKRETFNRMMGEGGAWVHFDPRHRDATVPEHLAKLKRTLFVYSHDFKIPLNDLLVTEHGVSASLSFNRVRQYTFVPWDAVFAIEPDDNGAPVVWAQGIAEDLLQEMVDTATAAALADMRVSKGGNA